MAQLAQVALAGTTGWKAQLDPGLELAHTHSYFDQSPAEGLKAGLLQPGCLSQLLAHLMQQPVGGCVKEQAELVGLPLVATGSVAGEVELVFFDPVLSLTPHAVDLFVEHLIALALDVGDNETHVHSPFTDIRTQSGLQSSNNMAWLGPGSGLIRGAGKVA